MKTTPIEYKLSKITKWLFALALFIGVISYSGFIVKSNSNQHQPVQTELLNLKNEKSSKQTFSFIKAFVKDKNRPFSIFISFFTMNKIYTSNLFTKVKSYNILRQNYSYKFVIIFLFQKSLLQSPEDSFFVKLKG